MNRRLLRTAGGVLGLLRALAACKGDEDVADSAPSCDDLQTEADECETTTPGEKDAFAQFAATCKAQDRFTVDCRKCLSGKVCGNTEECDPLCGK